MRKNFDNYQNALDPSKLGARAFLIVGNFQFHIAQGRSPALNLLINLYFTIMCAKRPCYLVGTGEIYSLRHA